MDIEALTERLARIPNVVAVTLGGSRARGEDRPDSDWDFGLYYRDRIDADDIRRLGFAGHVVAPGDWGRLVNGGAWLMIEGQRVDLLYRDLDFVMRWVREAERGKFEVDNVAGHLAGLPTYVLAGELALGKVLAGRLPRPTFPDALRQSAPPRWEGNAAFSLLYAGGYAGRGEVTACAGSLARAAVAASQARLAARGEWALNEKRIVQRAGLLEAEEILAHPGQRPDELGQAVTRMRRVLGLDRPEGLQADEVVRRHE